jgi:hypothetical protein
VLAILSKHPGLITPGVVENFFVLLHSSLVPTINETVSHQSTTSIGYYKTKDIITIM